MEEKEKVFSLEKFNQLIERTENRNNASQDILDACQELHRLLVNHNYTEEENKKCIFEMFNRDQIEWFADSLMNWPFDDGSGESGGLSHPIVGLLMQNDIIRNLGTAKKVKEKGFVFI